MKLRRNFGFAWRSIASVAACAVLLAGCASEPMTAPHLEANQRVEAHQYDKEWFNAAREGRWDILDALLKAGYPIDSVNSSGYTALILAGYDDHPDTLDKLLAAGANACAADHNGNTALMGVLYKGQLDIARTLLQTHCDINATNNAGETALAFAALFGRYSLFDDLVAHGADPNHTDARGNTALATVRAQGNLTAVQALKKIGATY
ncbi:hypothetical protein LMG28138_04373 [Pararobbsia alpina]|uniref:Ankyrin repeat protein n=2 Tax=Pararobbsia alpina TaxID=621374 RepID=A0A6S7BGN2_9BURK|nr:hypothetical protein LMG28138_04373 [Pararobbsia alpina]